MTPRWPKMDYDGFKMASICPRLGHWGNLGPPWGPLGASSGPTRRHFGPTWGQAALHKQKYHFFSLFFIVLRSVLGHLGVMSGPFWFILEPSWAILGPFWAISRFLWGHLGPSWGFWVSTPIGNTFSTGVGTPAGAISGAKMACDSPKMASRWPIWARHGLKMSPDGLRIDQYGCKMAPTTLFLRVVSGSALLFSFLLETVTIFLIIVFP